MGLMTYGLLLLLGGGALSAGLLLGLPLLEEGLRDQDLVVGGDGTIAKFRLVQGPAYRERYGQRAPARELQQLRHSSYWLTRAEFNR
jgi:hypothetical protein